jgi:F-type H+-transporting ATPase subunit delta
VRLAIGLTHGWKGALMAKAADMTNSLATTYAQALLDLALEAGAVDEVAQQVEQLRELVERDAGLRALLSSRLVSVGRRAESLERIFKGRVHDVLHRFLQVVNRKQRLAALSGMLAAFAALAEEHRGVREVDAYVAAPLSADQVSAVSSAVGRAIDRQVILNQHVDESLIGGLKLRVGDRLIDGSVSAQLRLLRRKLVAVGRDDARQRAGELLGE